MNAHVDIHRLQATYLVPRDLPASSGVKSRLDAVMQKRLANVSRQLLDQVLDIDDPSVWLIRQLDIELAVDISAMDEEQLAQLWSHHIVMAIVRAIAHGAEGDTVLHFSDRTAYVAQFVADFVEGRAWDKWYYTSFDSLRSLPSSAAIRELLIREPEQTEPVLLCLVEQGRFEQVLHVLSTGDAQRIYAVCCADHADTASGIQPRQLIEALLVAWQRVSLRTVPAGMATAHNALSLYVAFRTQLPRTMFDALRTAIDHLLGFAELLRQIEALDVCFTNSHPVFGALKSPKGLFFQRSALAQNLRNGHLGTFITRLVSGDLRGTLELVRSYGVTSHLESVSFFRHLAAGDCDWLTQVVRTVSPVASAREEVTKGAQQTAQTLTTSCGGIFLLLPSLLDLHLPELIETVPYPEPEGMTQAQALRYLLALKCLGRPRVMEAAYDPVLHLMSGFDETPSWEDLRQFSESATVAMDQACLRLLMERLARQGRVDGRYLGAELVASESSVQNILLLRDIARDTWVYATPASDDEAALQAALNQGLRLVQETIEVPCDYLLLGSGLGRCLASHLFAGWEDRIMCVEPDEMPGLAPLSLGSSSDEAQLVIWTSEPDAVSEESQIRIARYLTRAKPAAQELAYLSLANLTPSLITNSHYDLTWSLVAHAILRAFASRLMGFDWSSAAYLYHNFLAGISTVRIEGEAIDVQLPCSPLHVILRMAGVNGQSYTVPWLHDTQVTLSLMGD